MRSIAMTGLALAGTFLVAHAQRSAPAAPISVLLITGQSKRAVELLPLSPLHFFSQDSGSEFTFAGEGDAITHMRIDQQGQSFEARRVH